MDSFPSPQFLTCFCLPFIIFSCFYNIFQVYLSASSPESHAVSFVSCPKIRGQGLLSTSCCYWSSKFLMISHWPSSNKPGQKMEFELSKRYMLNDTSLDDMSLCAETQHSISSSHTLLSCNGFTGIFHVSASW